MPDNPRSAPTQCDGGTGTLVYLPAGSVRGGSAQLPLKINAEFHGLNPNPQGASDTPEQVDCRVDTGNPRSTTCAVYILGAGRESSNPAYLRVFPTQFNPLTKDRRDYIVKAMVEGNRATMRSAPTLVEGVATPFTVSLGSGLTPTVSSTTCSVNDSSIIALSNEGTCTVTITSSGGKNVKPLIRQYSFDLTS